MVEPAAPWISRPRMTIAPLLDSPMSTHDATNSARPNRKIRLRPYTSASAPAVTMTAAPTSEYPVTAHWSTEIGDPTSLLIAGNRMDTAEVLALTTSVDRHAASSRPPVGRRSAAAAGRS